jgi:hemolysin activation/secretion protein
VGRVDVERLLQKGASLELRHGVAATSSPVTSTYAQTTAEALAFAAFGSRWNLAVRARLATITRVPEHLELYVGGLDLVRGYADNRVRTRGYALTNVELRFVAFDSTWIALMPVAFTDMVLSESPKGPAGEDVPRALVSAGAGLRILVPKFVGTGFRFDLAVPAERPRVGLNVGVYQFF